MAAEVTGPKLKSAQHVTEQKWLEQVAKAAEKQVDLKVSLSSYDIYSAVDWGKRLFIYGKVSGSSLGHVSEWTFNLSLSPNFLSLFLRP